MSKKNYYFQWLYWNWDKSTVKITENHYHLAEQVEFEMTENEKEHGVIGKVLESGREEYQ